MLFECSRAESIPDALRPVIHSAWSNVEETGHFVRNHMHAWAAWSGVYYVQVDDRTGDIFFEDPRPGAKALRWPHVEVERNVVSFHPTPGMLLLFPSFVEHYTDPSRSAAERICISFNASLGVPGGAPEIRR